MSKTLSDQASWIRSNAQKEKEKDLLEGKLLCDEDSKKRDLERQMVEFKKQLFAQDLTD